MSVEWSGRAEDAQPGDACSTGVAVVAVTTVRDGDDEGITTLWWDDGLITYTTPSHRMSGLTRG